jgi:hypothetical protein
MTAPNGATARGTSQNDRGLGSAADRGVAALQGVTAGRFCVGCGLPFTARRPGQLACGPTCRVRALRRRRRQTAVRRPFQVFE